MSQEAARNIASVFHTIYNEDHSTVAAIQEGIFDILAEDKTPDGIVFHALIDELNRRVPNGNLNGAEIIGHLMPWKKANVLTLVAIDESNEPHIQMMKNCGCQT